MRRSNLWWGIILVCAGALLLLDNLGVLAPLNIKAGPLIFSLALIGLGGIGTAVAARALPFGMRVTAVRRTGAPSPVPGVTVVATGLGRASAKKVSTPFMVIRTGTDNGPAGLPDWPASQITSSPPW